MEKKSFRLFGMNWKYFAVFAAIVLVTHNIGVIGAMADRVLVMRNGETVEYGETEQVLNAPKEAYTRTLMAAVPRLKR